MAITRLFVDSLLACPDSPLPIHRARGIDKNSVKIETEWRRSETWSFFFLPQPDGGLSASAPAESAAQLITKLSC